MGGESADAWACLTSRRSCGPAEVRKDATKEFERYVDAVENPPEVDDYVEEEELGDQDHALPAGVSVQDIEDQLAARRAAARGQ